MSERVSIQAQADHFAWMSNTLDRLEPEAKKRGYATEREAPMRVRYTGAIRTTLAWLREHEERIKRFLPHAPEIEQLLAMEPEVRAAILAHGPNVAALAVEIAERERIAAAGGPTR